MEDFPYPLPMLLDGATGTCLLYTSPEGAFLVIGQALVL